MGKKYEDLEFKAEWNVPSRQPTFLDEIVARGIRSLFDEGEDATACVARLIEEDAPLVERKLGGKGAPIKSFQRQWEEVGSRRFRQGESSLLFVLGLPLARLRWRSKEGEIEARSREKAKSRVRIQRARRK